MCVDKFSNAPRKFPSKSCWIFLNDGDDGGDAVDAADATGAGASDTAGIAIAIELSSGDPLVVGKANAESVVGKANAESVVGKANAESFSTVSVPRALDLILVSVAESGVSLFLFPTKEDCAGEGV